MNCPACLSPGLGPAYMAAFAICGLFFLIAILALWWANRNGHLDGAEASKFNMLKDK